MGQAQKAQNFNRRSQGFDGSTELAECPELSRTVTKVRADLRFNFSAVRICVNLRSSAAFRAVGLRRAQSSRFAEADSFVVRVHSRLCRAVFFCG